MIGWLIAIGAVLAVAAIVLLLVRQPHPWDSASDYPVDHPEDNRPAGPGAETQDPDDLSGFPRPPE
jgi:hypothetical protein